MTLIEVATLIYAPIHVCFDLSLSIDLELEAANAYGIRAISGVITGNIGLHETVRWQAKQFGITLDHESEITQFEKPTFFQDTMISGIFKNFQHDHFFHNVGEGKTEMKDALRFSMPLWLLGTVSERVIVQYRLAQLIADRNRVIKQHAEEQSSTSRVLG